MPRAWCLIRSQPHYRREAFEAGLRAAGYEVKCEDLHVARIDMKAVRPDDRLVLWNRYGTGEVLGAQFERAGGQVIVAENGYLGDDSQGRQHYAIALGHHNGGGRWYVGGPERWRGLGVELKPWREDGQHILVCPQRGIGPKGYAQPTGWAEQVVSKVRASTRRPLRVRPHPGNVPQAEARASLARDLEGCWAMVTWASGAGIHALVAGVPVYYDAPRWILGNAGDKGVALLDTPTYAERWPAFEQMAWAQWTVGEIASGEPFKRLQELS